MKSYLTRTAKVASGVLAALTFVSGIAMADSPHFINCSASGPNNMGNLTVSFKVAGEGDNPTTTITASASATAVYACRNNGAKFPEDPKKQEEQADVEASDDFPSGKNGNITGSLTLRPPPTTLDCPPGQETVLVSISYTDVQLSEPSGDICSVSGTFTRVFFIL